MIDVSTKSEFTIAEVIASPTLVVTIPNAIKTTGLIIIRANKYHDTLFSLFAQSVLTESAPAAIATATIINIQLAIFIRYYHSKFFF